MRTPVHSFSPLLPAVAETPPRHRRPLLVAVFVALLLLLAGAGAGSERAAASVRTSATDHARPELLKTIPIGGSPWSEARSVMSIPPARLGSLANGDVVGATGEAEITICLKPDPLHPGGGQPCVGDIYSYNPELKAKLVLAPSSSASNGSNTKDISRTVSLTCRQDHPVRNHHCVVSVPWKKFKISDTSSLPCDPAKCFINMLVSASNSNARSGEKVVVGSSDDNKRIHQSLGKVSAVRYRGSSKPKRWRGGRVTSKIPVVAKESKVKRTVAYSARIAKLKSGDQLVVDANVRTAIKGLPYNVFQRTEVVLAKSRHSIKPFGKLSESTARISASNGFNCTQGRSGHSNVCTIRKGGILSVKRNAKGPFYVNVVVGQSAIGTSTQYKRWRSGQKSKVPRRGGWVKVERYKGTGSCKTCSTGNVSFSGSNQPSSDRPAKLVRQLAGFGITEGTYNCLTRTQPTEYICKWTAEGRVGSSPRYECNSKAWYRKKAGNFDLNVCKEQLGAQLWNQLVNADIPVLPNYTGACKEMQNGNFVCKWYGEGVLGNLEGRFCKGVGVYDPKAHRWNVDRCKNPNA